MMPLNAEADHPDTLLIRGGAPLGGEVEVGGFKHAFVTTTAAGLLSDQDLILENVPQINETTALKALVSGLGGHVRNEGPRTLRINCTGLDRSSLDPDTAGSIHGSVYLVPGIIARLGEVVFPESGGCRIGAGGGGTRPIAQYLDVLKRFGVQVSYEPSGLRLRARRLEATEIDLADYTVDRRMLTGPLYSGATKAALLTAAVAHGTSVIRHPYPKPDVTELVAVLRSMGCDVTDDPEVIRIRGSAGEPLSTPARHVLCADLIEVVTWIALGAISSPEGITARGVGVGRALAGLAPELAVLRRFGVELRVGEDTVTACRTTRLSPTDVVVQSRGIFSDSHPLLALVACLADGRSRFTETVWTKRFSYVEELKELGVRARTHGPTLTVEGPWIPVTPSRPLVASDLRAAAVLVMASVLVPGQTRVAGVRHLARGYRSFAGKLAQLGVDVQALPAGSMAEDGVRPC